MQKFPFFCALTETAQDIIKRIMVHPLPSHPFEHKMMPPPTAFTHPPTVPFGPLTKQYGTVLEVYVDDFIGMTNHPLRSYILQLSRAMLHGIHALFPPP